MNSTEHKVFKDWTTKTKNLLSNKQLKKENLRSKLDKKPLNHDKNTEEENRI